MNRSVSSHLSRQSSECDAGLFQTVAKIGHRKLSARPMKFACRVSPKILRRSAIRLDDGQIGALNGECSHRTAALRDEKNPARTTRGPPRAARSVGRHAIYRRTTRHLYPQKRRFFQTPSVSAPPRGTARASA